MFTWNYDRWTGRKTRFCWTEQIFFLKLCLFPFRFSKLSKLNFHANAALSQWFLNFFCCVLLHVYFDIFFVGGKVFYCYVIVSFEKSSNLHSLKLPSTYVCLWKSTQTVLHSKYRFCSKNANQTGNTSSLLVHCLKQYPVISCSHGWSCQGNWK